MADIVSSLNRDARKLKQKSAWNHLLKTQGVRRAAEEGRRSTAQRNQVPRVGYGAATLVADLALLSAAEARRSIGLPRYDGFPSGWDSDSAGEECWAIRAEIISECNDLISTVHLNCTFKRKCLPNALRLFELVARLQSQAMSSRAQSRDLSCPE